MDCCQPQEGSGAPGSTGTKAPATLLPSLAVSAMAPADATPIWTGRPGDSLELHGPLYTLHSVFRI